jgi:multidrug efflux pump subunit AcrA (membrane-fusion protein)
MKKLLFVLIIIILSALVFTGCSKTPEPAPAPEEPQGQSTTARGNTASGVVAPAQFGSLSLPVGGMIAEVLVKEGEQVQAGQPLIRLRGSDPENLDKELQARIAAAELEIQTAQKALDDLDKNAVLARDEALRQSALAAQQVRDAQYSLDNLSIPSNQKDLDPFEAFDQMKANYDKAWKAYEPVKDLDENTDLRQERQDDLESAQSDLNAALRRVQLTIDLQTAQSALEKARQDSATYQDGPDPKDVALAQARLANAETALAAARAVIDDRELVAPYAGTVTALSVKPGEFAAPGAPLLQLADLSRLQVETTDLDEAGTAQLAAGDAVKVSFDALPGVEVPGTVVYIPPKAIEGAGGDFKVIVALDELPAGLRWGMTAFVDFQP